MNTKAQFSRKKRTLVIAISLALVLIAAFSTVYILNQQKQKVNANVTNVETKQTEQAAPIADSKKVEEVKEVETTVAPAQTQTVAPQQSQSQQSTPAVTNEDTEAKAKRLQQCNDFKAHLASSYGPDWYTTNRHMLSGANESTYRTVCKEFDSSLN